MSTTTGGELIPADPEIERTFHRLQRENREAPQQRQEQMANLQNNSIFQANEGEATDEGNEILGEFLTTQVIQSLFSIVYPLFRQTNFQLKTNVIKLFQNGHQFCGRVEENPHTHISRFLDMC